MIERRGRGTALSRSSTLSAGLKGHVLETLLLAGWSTFAIMLGIDAHGGHDSKPRS